MPSTLMMHTDYILLSESKPNFDEGREREPGLPFTFRLSGILPLPESLSRGEDVRISARLVSSVATALPRGARAIFQHHRTSAGEIGWTLEGMDKSADAQLTTTLRCALAANGGAFQFESGEAFVSEPWPHSVKLRPLLRMLPAQRPIGFAVGAAIDSATVEILRLPAAVRLRSPIFPSLGGLLQTAPCAASARVGITRMALTDGDIEKLREAARRLRSHSSAAAAVGWLEEWMRLPLGWRLDCEVTSREPLAEPLLQLIGGEVFGQQVEIVSGDFYERTSAVLDLSACRHAENPLPRLFPAGTFLASLRQPRSYNRELPHLPTSGALIGEVECKGTIHPLYLPTEARDRHCWLVGATGTGKSNLLLRMLRQDIEAGEGVALIDPHGDLFEQILESIPPKRIGDVVLLEPGRGSRVPGLNFLDVTDGPLRELQRNFVINELLGIFGQLWDMRECGGPMFQVYFRNAVLLLMGGGSPDVTLTELPLVFEDRAFRERLKAACRDPLVTGFWTKQAEKAGSDASLNKIARTSRPSSMASFRVQCSGQLSVRRDQRSTFAACSQNAASSSSIFQRDLSATQRRDCWGCCFSGVSSPPGWSGRCCHRIGARHSRSSWMRRRISSHPHSLRCFRKPANSGSGSRWQIRISRNSPARAGTICSRPCSAMSAVSPHSALGQWIHKAWRSILARRSMRRHWSVCQTFTRWGASSRMKGRSIRWYSVHCRLCPPCMLVLPPRCDGSSAATHAPSLKWRKKSARDGKCAGPMWP